MPNATHIIDGSPYCGELSIVGSNVTFTGLVGACVAPPPGDVPPGRALRSNVTYPNSGNSQAVPAGNGQCYLVTE